MKVSLKKCKIIIFFGGPSNERNISLDSARTFYDSVRHYLLPKNLTLIFVSKDKNFYFLNPKWIYSNTVNDFEDLFQAHNNRDSRSQKESRTRKKKSLVAGYKLSVQELNRLIDEADGFFPLIHGTFGEDGKLTSILLKRGRKAILGSSPKVLYESLKKNLSHHRLESLGFKTCRYLLIEKIDWVRFPVEAIKKIKDYFRGLRKLDIVIKPNDCGSSDGVSMVYNPEKIEEAMDHAFLFSDEVLIEEKIYGKEFSIILIEDNEGKAISLFPTEIVLKKKHQQDTFYSRQKKYMPGSGVNHITPANFSKQHTEKIRKESEYIFQEFGFHDWARFDGFLLPDGSVIWSDLNSIPGIGQDGLLFQQSIYLGIDTFNLCRFILNKVIKKENKVIENKLPSENNRKVIGVLGGGSTSERQVSRMSWCNVIEKLDRLQIYDLRYLFMDKKNKIWLVPRPYTLKHTTEEIEQLIKQSKKIYSFPSFETISQRIKKNFPRVKRQNFIPKSITFNELKRSIDYLFSCLHGGIGEDGTLQKKCEKIKIPFNGSDSRVSHLTFDKSQNHTLINQLRGQLQSNKILIPQQVSIDFLQIKKKLEQQNWNSKRIQTYASKIVKSTFDLKGVKKIKREPTFQEFANKVLLLVQDQTNHFFSKVFDQPSTQINNWKRKKKVIKPAADGCSTGVVVCDDFTYQLPLYLLLCLSRYRLVPSVLFYPNKTDDKNFSKLKEEKEILLPKVDHNRHRKLILEEFLDTKKGYIELTIGVFGRKREMISLIPSKTIAELQVLSLDEKFNKGVGINLTPPRELNSYDIQSIREKVAVFANRIGLSDYARIDFFYHLKKKRLYLIEVNTLPGLTAATILFTQVLVTPEMESPPSEFLKHIIDISLVSNISENRKHTIRSKNE